MGEGEREYAAMTEPVNPTLRSILLQQARDIANIAGDDASREAAKRMSVRGPSPTCSCGVALDVSHYCSTRDHCYTTTRTAEDSRTP